MRKTVFHLLLLILLSFHFGCRDRIILPGQEEKEIFEGVLDSSGMELTPGTRGGTFIRADILELDSLNIVTTRSRSVYSVLKLVFEGLLSIDPITGEIQEGISTDYSIINNGYSLLFHLNENIRFSDGAPCTAADVIFSFEEIYMNPDVDSKITDALKIRDKLITVEKLDDVTIRIDLPVPYRPFLYTLAHIDILPKHIIEPLIKKDGIEAFNRGWGNIKNDIHNIIGTGPYYIKEFKNGEFIKLARNQYYNKRDGGLYFDGMPYLDEIIELLDIDNESKLLKFQIGEIDFYDVTDTDIASSDFETLLSNKSDGNYQLYSGGQTLRSNHFLVFNQNPNTVEKEKLDVFQNLLFRRAVSLLIDTKAIVSDIYKGYAYIDFSPERNVSPFYRNKEAPGYDIQKAQNLLDQIPLPDRDGDGYRDLPSGNSLHFTILTNKDNPYRIKMGETISESLKNAGLNTDFVPADYDVIVTKFLDTFEWDAVILGMDGSIEPNESSWIWESKGTYHLWNPYQERPNTEWEKRIDELFALGRTTWDFDKAKAFYHEYQDIIALELPVINIVVPAELYGLRNGYGNAAPTAVTYNAIGLMPYLYKKKKSGSKIIIIDSKKAKE